MGKFNYDSFLTEIENTKQKETYNKYEEKFAKFIKEYLGTNLLTFTGETNDKGIDGVYFVSGANKLTLFQFKMGKPSNKMDLNLAQDIEAKMLRFIKSEKSTDHRNNALSEAATKIHQGKIKEIDMIIFTTYTFARGVEGGSDFPKNDSTEINGMKIQTTTYYYDNSMFFDMVHTLKTNKSFNETVNGKDMVFKLEKGNFIEHSKDEGYTVMVKATELYDHVLDLVSTKNNISALTHKNVRDFLGTVEDNDEDISSGILKTLTDAKDGKDLYAYHMGMVVLCENLKVENDKLIVTSPSFVNGAQSLGTLIAKAKKSDLNPDAAFTIRFIKSPSTSKESKEFSDKVVIRTNSSNPITPQMKYAFDPKQPLIARMFEDRGYYYDYRAAEAKAKSKIKDSIKKTAALITFNDIGKITEFPVKMDVKPDEVAAAIYAIQKKSVKAQRSNKNVFRYSSNMSSDYYSVFYNDGTIRPFIEYFAPLALHKLLLERMRDEFTINSDMKFHDYRKNLFKLDFNQAKKIQWLFYIEFLKENHINAISDLVEIFDSEENPYLFLKDRLNNFLKKTNTDLQDSKTKSSAVKQYLLKNKVINMADAVR